MQTGIRPNLFVMERTVQDAAAHEVEYENPTVFQREAMRRLYLRHDHYLNVGCMMRYSKDRTAFVAELDGRFFASAAIIAEGQS